MSRHDWGFINDALWRVKRIRATLDARFADVPMIQHRPIPNPEGHPDLLDSDDTFAADLAELYAASEPVMAVGWGRAEQEDAAIYDEMLAELGPFSAAPTLHLAIDMAAFDYIADDIQRWRTAA